jgi:predicted PurR-regulated permease PerM
VIAGRPSAKWISFRVRSSRSIYQLTIVYASVALLLAVIFPLWKPLLVGAVLAAALAPRHERLSARLRGRRSLAAGLLLTGLVLLVLGPLAWLVSVAVRETLAGIDFVRESLQNGPEALLGHLPGWIAGPVKSGLEKFSTGANELTGFLAQRGPSTAAAVGTAVGATAGVVVNAVFLLIAFYFFLVGGRRLVQWLADVSPSSEETLAIAAQLARASRSVLSSLFLTALAQALTATIGYLIARVPHSVFFGLLTFLAAFIPSVGTTIVALPVALLMVVLGHPWAGLFVALWGLVVVGLIDNVVKPLLIKGGVQLDAAVLFFALIGGLALFGATGLIVGPLAVVLFVTVAGRRRDAALARRAPEPEPPAAPH